MSSCRGATSTERRKLPQTYETVVARHLQLLGISAIHHFQKNLHVRAVQILGGVDILVNNAAISTRE